MSDSDLPESLGRYRVLSRIGAGGMAEVFLAKSTGAEGIEKILVVKRILPSFARSAKFLTMFIDEAKVAMRLNHPNIVQVYAFDQEKDQFLLAMEYVDGLDLGRLISGARRRGMSMPHGIAAYVVMEIAKGLDYAHRRKDEHGEPMEIVHRDVSPQNVLLTYEGVVKVADFGIAKARLVSEETGIIKGKFGYMSPEQARGERVDRRSDVYALGVLLAELVMGRKMYLGKEGLEVLEAVRSGEITLPSDVSPDVPDEINRIVKRATSFDREERYQTARSLAGALGQFLHGLDDVYDGEVLERFISDVSPRERTSPEVRPRHKTSGGPRTGDLSGSDRRPRTRERRHVVVIEVCLRADEHTDSGGDLSVPGLSDKAVSVMNDIAFKIDAVVNWPDGKGHRRMRFVLGLGKPTVNDPLLAMRTSLDIIEALNGLSDDMLHRLTASIGVSRGVMSTERDANGRLKDYRPTDEVLIISEKLASVAKAGEIWTAGAVYRHVRRMYSFDEDSRQVEVQGDEETKGVSLRSYRLLGLRTREERAAEVKASTSTMGLIGRTPEITAIQQAFIDAKATKSNCYVGVEGDLGVGKTALVAAAIDTMEPRPRVLRSECGFGTSDVPFAATAEIVREACSIPDNATPDEARAQLRATLKELVPKKALRQAAFEGLEALVAKVERDRDQDAAGDDKFRVILRGVEVLLTAFAKEGPFIVWIDAMQWIDLPSLETLRAMLHRGYNYPVLIVLSTRPDPRLEPTLSGIPRIELNELDLVDRTRLIREAFNGATIDEAVERSIVDRAGGNPYFILELVEALQERGSVHTVERDGDMRVERNQNVPLVLPSTLEDVVAARLGEVPEEHRWVLRWLAVAVGGLREQDVSELSGIDAGESLKNLVGRGLLELRPTGSYHFPGALVRHVAYDTTDEEDRQMMHRKVADHLSRLENPLAERVAWHLAQAGDRAAAANSYFEAAAAARSDYSNRSALQFYARALRLLPQTSHRRFAAHEAREEIMRGMGNRADRKREVDQMRIYADHSGDPELVATAYNRLARYLIDSTQSNSVGDFLQKSLRAARQAGSRASEVEALRLTAQVAGDEGDLQRSLDSCREALARAGDVPGLLSARGAVRIQLGQVYRLLGRVDEAEEACAEATVIFKRLGYRGLEAHALNGLGVVLAVKGEYEDAIAVIRSSISVDREIGERLYLGRKLSNIGQLYKELGDVDRCIEFLGHALKVFEFVHDDLALADALNSLAEVVLEEREDVERASVHLDRARVISQRTQDPYDSSRERIMRAAIHRQAGELEEAEVCCREGWDIAREAGIVSQGLQAQADLSNILVDLERDDEAKEIATEALEGLESHEVVERVERVYLALARTFDRLQEQEKNAICIEVASGLVEERLKRIRDPEMRAFYEQTRAVRTLRESSP